MDARGMQRYQDPRMTMTGHSYNGSLPGSIPINGSMENHNQETFGLQGVHLSDDHTTFTHKTHLNRMQVQQNYSELPIRKEVDDEGRIFGVVLPEPPAQYSPETPAQHPPETPAELPTDGKRIYGVVLPETPVQHPPENPTEVPTEGNNSEHSEIPQNEIKTEKEDDISYFMEAAHETFLKVSSKEITLKRASDILGRPYSFVYTRYHEFCNPPKKKKEEIKIEKPEKKVRKKYYESDPDEDEPKKKTYYESSDYEEDEPKRKKVKKKRGKKKGRAKNLGWAYNKSKSSGKKFECEECPGVFYTEYLFKTHMKVHTEKNVEVHTCSVCGMMCAKLLQLMRHRIEVHEEALQCPHCDSQFTVIADYKKHIKSHAGIGPWVCKECGKGYHSKFHLENHSRKHTGERPFMCGYCEKTFMTLQHLKSHTMSLHEGIPKNKNYECQLCERKYQSAADLQDHMNVHSGAKPYACDLCEARFNFKTGLERHRVTHSDVHPYQCDLCPAGFYQKKNFEQHKIVHTGEKAFKCDLCDFSCTRKHTLEYHKYEHTGEKPFKCNFYGCTAAYTKPQSLNHHKVKKHGVPPCKVCGEKFPDVNSLNRHMMIHTGEKPQTCEVCLKTFYKKSSMKRHMYSHMDRPAGSKNKARQARNNRPIVDKKPEQYVTTHKILTSEYQVPTAAENGHNLFVPSLNTNPEESYIQVQHSQPQPTLHPFTAVSNYSNLVNTNIVNSIPVNNSWPSAMDADELRRRLLNSFK